MQDRSSSTAVATSDDRAPFFPDARKNDAGMLSLELYDRILDEDGPYLFQCQIFGQGGALKNWKLTSEIIARTHARNIFTPRPEPVVGAFPGEVDR